jgi:hypothetical protein
MVLEMQVLEQAKTCGGVKSVIGIEPSDNWVSNDNTVINKQ